MHDPRIAAVLILTFGQIEAAAPAFAHGRTSGWIPGGRMAGVRKPVVTS